MATAPPTLASTHRPGRGALPEDQPGAGRLCLWENLGRLGYREAWDRQLEYVAILKQGVDSDRFLFVEHPHTVTLGRNACEQNILVSPERMGQLGIALEETDRGGDVTYHGPGQIVGYPILDLTQWKRDVAAYMRALEEVLIRTLSDFGLAGERLEGATGVWVDGAKVCAMGVHISRWITSHGFALNVNTDLRHFQLIVPCGIADRGVTSIEQQIGRRVEMTDAEDAVVDGMRAVFGALVSGRRT